MPLFDIAVVTTFVAGSSLALLAYLLVRRRREAHDTARLAHAQAEKQHIPPSLHPIIDADICIGSLSCVKACPEGDILGLVDGKAKLVEASHCIGHSRCAVECPVDAIKLVFGTSEKGVDLPETDEKFESSRPGVFIVGELGGMGLIKNALRQGLQAADALKKELGRPTSTPNQVDVVIVGAGPAGIACAANCKHHGLSYRLVEQDTVGGTVFNFPRNKVVMTEALQIPFYGTVGRNLLSKEELLEQFQGLIQKAGLRVEEGVRVEGIDGERDTFVLHTNRGDIAGRRVVLATGLRGTPRKLGAKGEDRPKVTYRLIDPTQYDKQRVLIVGGGDSAVEAAIQLATESSAKVTISYRQDSFSRAKPRNREIIADLIQQKRVRALMGTEVVEIHDDQVMLKNPAGQVGRLKNDNVIVAVGGELPTKFLEKCGVSIRRYHGEEKRAEGAKAAAVRFQVKDNRRLAVALTVLGALILAGLALVGQEYYFLDDELRREHPLHELLKPAGLWGHGVGVVATLFMMSNFIYVLRKRWARLKGISHIRTWLTMHMFVGVMSPIVIALLAAFQSRNFLALATWIALGIVVSTGIFGRFLFGMVPAQSGRLMALKEVELAFKGERERLTPHLDEVTNTSAVHLLMDELVRPPASLGLIGMLLYVPRNRRRVMRMAEKVRRFFVEEERYQAFREGLVILMKMRVQCAFYEQVKRLFRVWLALHVVLATFMVFLIAVHVAVSLYLGYMWVFTPPAA